MLNSINSFNNTHQLFFKNNKLILAISGGMDSMVLLHLFSQINNIEIIVAHCNFKLRAKESDKDQEFVEKIANSYGFTFITIDFETTDYSKINKLSIEEAARELRYEWFEKIRKEQKANLIVTAHHLNDNTETLLFNITKGTGIKGLRGMLPKRGKIIRPMLEILQERITQFAQDNEIAYREDSSNNSLKHTRNLIRKNIVPELEKVNTNFSKTQLKHFQRFRDIELFYADVLQKIKSELFEDKKGDYYIAINKLLKYRGYKTLFFELMSEFGFPNLQIEDVLSVIDSKESGKVFFSKTHRIVKDRKHFILSDMQKEVLNLFDISKSKTTIKLPNAELIRVHIKPIDKLTKMSSKNHYAYVDMGKLTFPLVLRRWKDGDYFYPFGMNNKNGKAKKKKIKKFFSDQKLSIVDKEKVWILTSGDKIVWVVNFRTDDRFKVTKNTKTVYQLKFVECKN